MTKQSTCQTSFMELPIERNLVDLIKESMEHDKIKDMEYVDLLKEIILYLKIELSHKNEQLTTFIKSLNVNVEVRSKHLKIQGNSGELVHSLFFLHKYCQPQQRKLWYSQVLCGFWPSSLHTLFKMTGVQADQKGATTI